MFINRRRKKKTENPPKDALEKVENCSSCIVQGDQTDLGDQIDQGAQTDQDHWGDQTDLKSIPLLGAPVRPPADQQRAAFPHIRPGDK